MIYKDRTDAALILSRELEKYRGQNGVIIAIPRGGLPIGSVCAKHLGFPLDVVLTKKIGHPRNREYAIGALSLTGSVLNEALVIPAKYIENETQRLRALLEAKYKMYYRDRTPINLRNKMVIITDDGAATGTTLLAAIDLIKQAGARKIVVALPVASPPALSKIKTKVNDIICLQTPWNFHAVGNYYHTFEQVTDESAVSILEKAYSISSH